MSNKYTKMIIIITQWDILTYLLELLKSQSLIISIIGEAMEEAELSYTAVEDVKWYNDFGKQSGCFLKS